MTSESHPSRLRSFSVAWLVACITASCTPDSESVGNASGSTSEASTQGNDTDAPGETESPGATSGASTSGSETGATDPGGTQSGGESTTAAETGTGGPSEETGGEETGSSANSCSQLDCDPAEYCHESIIDAPSEFSCRAIPAECVGDLTCDCIVPIVCPEHLQSCAETENGFVVQCVEG